LFVCGGGRSACVHTLKGKRLGLSTPKLVEMYSMAVAQHALTLRSKGQSQGHTVTVAWLLWPCGAAAGVVLLVV